nr:SUMF1/EgtB/PvdO family nonheme iron enzyme [Treponema sp.]
MKICPKCNKEFPDDVNFCKYDGTKLAEKNAKTESEKKCPKCGAPAVNGAKFCNMCGSPLTAETKTSPQPKSISSKNTESPRENESCEMVFVDGGRFERKGCDITVSSFEMGKYPVTQGLYENVMHKNPSSFRGQELPVECVSWYDAVEFCNALSRKDGFEPCYRGKGSSVKCDLTKNGYRLPTEAEWEFAARGGNQSRGYEYSGGDNVEEVAWYEGNSNNRTHEGWKKKANELGLYDMSGNVWEWCNDWYGEYPDEDENDPCGASSGSSRVLRGGSWYHGSNACAVSFRNLNNPDNRYYNIGFRIVRSM